MDENFYTVIRDLRTGRIVRHSKPIPLSKWPFRVAEPDGRLWRYGDYWKMKGLLVAGEMYFRRADRLADVKEGRFTKANIEGASLIGESLGLPESNADIIKIQESHRCRVFLNCWHRNHAENPRMWSEYTTSPESIVITCGARGLQHAVAGRCEAFDVNYIGDDDPIPDFHSMSVFAYKRKDPFEFEREFRLALMLPAEESVWIDKREDYGRILKIAPKDFIDEVRFHPDATDAFRALVRADLAVAGFDVPIRDAESSPKG